MLLIAAVTFAALSASPKSPAAALHCPQAPFAVPATAAPPGLTCPALEVSGRADRSDPSLDPAFDTAIVPSRFPASAPGAPEGVLQGLDAQGRVIFAQVMGVGGEFHTFVPLPDNVARQLARIRLTVGTSVVERSPVMHGDPSIETISVDDSHVLLAWNGKYFPAIRVRESPNGPLIAVASGSSTYDEVTAATSASVLTIDFSDGVRSVSGRSSLRPLAGVRNLACAI